MISVLFGVDNSNFQCYNIITVKNERGEKVKSKKKTAEILKEIDSNLDTVLSILGKLALVGASIKTIIDVIVKL